MKKNIFPLIAALVTVIIILGIYSNFLEGMIVENPDMSGPPPGIDKNLEEVTMEEMLTTAANRSVPIYLPSQLPKNLEITAVYMSTKTFRIIIPFNSNSDKNYHTAEFYIGITQDSSPPTFSEMQTWAEGKETETALFISGWLIYLIENASISIPERREVYGETQFTADAYRDGIEYTFVMATLTMDEFIDIIYCMVLEN